MSVWPCKAARWSAEMSYSPDSTKPNCWSGQNCQFSSNHQFWSIVVKIVNIVHYKFCYFGFAICTKLDAVSIFSKIIMRSGKIFCFTDESTDLEFLGRINMFVQMFHDTKVNSTRSQIKSVRLKEGKATLLVDINTLSDQLVHLLEGQVKLWSLYYQINYSLRLSIYYCYSFCM